MDFRTNEERMSEEFEASLIKDNFINIVISDNPDKELFLATNLGMFYLENQTFLIFWFLQNVFLLVVKQRIIGRKPIELLKQVVRRSL
jgi:hypothetical protein